VETEGGQQLLLKYHAGRLMPKLIVAGGAKAAEFARQNRGRELWLAQACDALPIKFLIQRSRM